MPPAPQQLLDACNEPWCSGRRRRAASATSGPKVRYCCTNRLLPPTLSHTPCSNCSEHHEQVSLPGLGCDGHPPGPKMHGSSADSPLQARGMAASDDKTLKQRKFTVKTNRSLTECHRMSAFFGAVASNMFQKCYVLQLAHATINLQSWVSLGHSARRAARDKINKQPRGSKQRKADKRVLGG